MRRRRTVLLFAKESELASETRLRIRVWGFGLKTCSHASSIATASRSRGLCACVILLPHPEAKAAAIAVRALRLPLIAVGEELQCPAYLGTPYYCQVKRVDLLREALRLCTLRRGAYGFGRAA